MEEGAGGSVLIGRTIKQLCSTSTLTDGLWKKLKDIYCPA